METKAKGMEKMPTSPTEQSGDKVEKEVTVDEVLGKTAEHINQSAASLPANLPVDDQSPKTMASAKPLAIVEIEDILSDGLGEFYQQLSVSEKENFRVSGEKTAVEIDSLLQQAKVKIKEIINLIRGWLQSVPGLNKFFVEQSAKIKADKILIKRGRR
ncbi:MAG: hypothetical protein ACKKL5_03140 [Candidatus Komeilibacteria bacterium]